MYFLLQTLSHSFQSYVASFFAQKTRPDGRLFSMCRKTQVTTGIIEKHAAGSALVKIGETQVLCGVVLQVGVPSLQPNCGDLDFGEDPEIERLLTEMVDLTCLSIEEGKSAWRLKLSFQVLNDEGNAWDASFIAGVAALRDTKLPATKTNSNKIVEIVDDKTTPLRFNCLLVPLTIGLSQSTNGDDKISLIADPTNDEQCILAGQLTLVVTPESKEIVNTQHAATVGISREELALCAHMAFGRGKEIQKLLQDDA